MNNNLLGKTLKAMYKQSGKTITQLSEETGLSIDTINNLFYARVQKPGLLDVDLLTKAMGFSLVQLMEFTAQKLPDGADVTAAFVKYTMSAEKLTNQMQQEHENEQNYIDKIEKLNAEHEKQLDRFKATHLMYVDHIQNQYKAQIAEMEKIFHNDKALNISRLTNRILGIALFLETTALILITFFNA